MRADPATAPPRNIRYCDPNRPWPALLAALTTGILLAASHGAADSMATESAALPTPRGWTSAVWDEASRVAYVFGGILPSDGDGKNEIIRYDPLTGTASLANVTLPSARISTSVVWNGQHAFLFGGTGCHDDGFSNHCTRIDRYDPASGNVTVMGAEFPFRYQTSAVWSGQYAYVFGGGGGCLWVCDEIFRYDPATDTVTKMNATLPTPRSGTSAIWDGRYAYVFGGVGCPTSSASVCPVAVYHNEILRYDPAADTIEMMNGKLIPTGRTSTAAVWDGRYAYVFGGYHQVIEATDRIVRYDPATDTTAIMDATLPTPRQGMSAVWDGGGNAYLFGGHGCPGDPNSYCSDILHYNLAPGAPLALAAAPGPSPGAVTLAWAPPAPHTYSAPVTAYHVYRSTTPTTPTFLDQTPAGTHTYTDSTCPGPACHYWVSAVNAVGEGPRAGPALAPVVGP